ncbi:TPA: hypothetical protein DD449_00760 [Candidatus Berkelbacteria bacterium]|uniref:Uncharacterized protein n=1 Tax=Berkelbacteria bacterium GW2011_GWE1_39_12 TaxID=1618337 RepID=A0A0G4B466_9BACT|nr:MAG: hypothetical protein UT28_C0001G0934 [Berkelbacteria bacterium GW2011_GWE1_39_12]HBO60202.1 hypothetical protein [Candidatus Berkelbacteria bacterium]
MGIIDRLKCLFSGHSWSNWKYNTDSECVQKRKCMRAGCRATEVRVKHAESEPTLTENHPCAKVVRCKRCHIPLGESKMICDFNNGKCRRCGRDEPPSAPAKTNGVDYSKWREICDPHPDENKRKTSRPK